MKGGGVAIGKMNIGECEVGDGWKAFDELYQARSRDGCRTDAEGVKGFFTLRPVLDKFRNILRKIEIV
jgi:hypothetical protein